ncbi:hypothetical protein KSP39_PZI021771 [Platanthera zijinensis]|uniref:Uncharacterized protein n=1 Tax=Platanthera zijinensis TaxID=2320716 RepID=A0AAP0AWQ9_9ASPA
MFAPMKRNGSFCSTWYQRREKKMRLLLPPALHATSASALRATPAPALCADPRLRLCARLPPPALRDTSSFGAARVTPTEDLRLKGCGNPPPSAHLATTTSEFYGGPPPLELPYLRSMEDLRH